VDLRTFSLPFFPVLSSPSSRPQNDNHGEYCGGESSIDIYFTRQTTKVRPLPFSISSSRALLTHSPRAQLIDDDLWSYQGCYQDNANNIRTLGNLVWPTGVATWTIEKVRFASSLLSFSSLTTSSSSHAVPRRCQPRRVCVRRRRVWRRVFVAFPFTLLPLTVFTDSSSSLTRLGFQRHRRSR
jgi:hypothetical protein